MSFSMVDLATNAGMSDLVLSQNLVAEFRPLIRSLVYYGSLHAGCNLRPFVCWSEIKPGLLF
jgi:hypothetical protein